MLETTFLIDLERERHRAEEGPAHRYLGSRPEERLHVATTTAGELGAGIELAVARAKRDQKCWAGGDSGHQQAQADAWSNLGRCQRLLR